MASVQDLIGLGLPAAQARLMGLEVQTKAGAGTAQVGATGLGPNTSVIATTAGGQTAFLLPAANPGTFVFFQNTSATAALVFPPSGGTIQGGGANASFSVAQNKPTLFVKMTATAWAAILSA